VNVEEVEVQLVPVPDNGSPVIVVTSEDSSHVA
jgi:hypothetical protein